MASKPADRVRASLRERVSWNRVYRTVSYLRSALWVVPFTAIVLALVLFRALRALDQWTHLELLGLTTTGAQALFQTVITLTLSVLVFTFGSLLVAIQVASAQMTPRIIATTLLRDRVVRYTVGLNVFTLLLGVGALNRLSESVAVPQLVVWVTSLCGLVCVASFLFLIDHAARLLRPVQIVALVGDQGLEVIKAVYQDELVTAPEARSPVRESLGLPTRVVYHKGTSQIVLALDIEALIAEARRVNGVIEFVPKVGDFVAADDLLFRLYGTAGQIDEEVLRDAVAMGRERTLEQDPAFAFRILVDIALKALSPAINDPTTAVIAIDQIQRLMRVVGRRQLHDEQILDRGGTCRLLLKTPDWEDYVDLAFTEIRACGANSVQVARRLRAMIESLMRTLPESRHAALQLELDLLDRTILDLYKQPEDLALAKVADVQGLGGATSIRTTS